MTEFVFLQRGLRDMTSALEGERTKLIVCSLKILQMLRKPTGLGKKLVSGCVNAEGRQGRSGKQQQQQNSPNLGTVF